MTSDKSILGRLINGDLSIPFYFSLTNFLLLITVNAMGGYGIFRDEYYYLACAENLAAGYVDHPPLSIFLLKLNVLVFGDSLFAIRLLPAVCSALTVFFIGLMSRRMGGGKLALIVSCLFAISPGNMVMSSFVSMNSIEILSWTLAAYTILVLMQTGDKKYWIILGVILGLGLLNKIGVLFLGAGIFAGLLFTDLRKWFATPWPYVSGAIAFILFLPYIIWNIQHDLAHLEFIKNASSSKYSGLQMMDFVKGQFLINHPIAILIWIPGLIALFFNSQLKQFRMLGFMYLIPFLIFLFNKTSKEVYLLPAYGMIWAAAGVWWEMMVRRYKAAKFVLGTVATAWLILTILLIPMVLPVLPVEDYIAHAKRMGFEPDSAENKELAELPQFYADMFGWKQKAYDVQFVYNSLSEEEKKKCAIIGSNYGRCASIDYFSDELGLPKTIGTHNNYWIWGPRGYNGEVLIIMGGEYEDHVDDFKEVKLARVSDCDYCMPYEDNLNIFICRGLKGNIHDIWPAEKHFD